MRLIEWRSMANVKQKPSQPQLDFDLSTEDASAKLRERIGLEKVNFSSRGELACAVMLKRHLGIKILDGVTFQRPMAHGTKADFFLPEQGITLEFHPIIIQHEFKNREKYYKFSQAMCRLKEREREPIYKALEGEFRDRYFWIRNLHRRSSEDRQVSESELVVVCCAGEFYDSIIKHYGKNVPDREDFITQFRKITDSPQRYEAEIYS